MKNSIFIFILVICSLSACDKDDNRMKTDPFIFNLNCENGEFDGNPVCINDTNYNINFGRSYWITYYRDEADSSTLSLDWRLVLQNLGDSAVGIRLCLNNINSREHQVCFSKDKEQLDKCRLILENIPKQQFSIYTSSPDYPLYLTWDTFDWNNKGRSDKEYYIEKLGIRGHLWGTFYNKDKPDETHTINIKFILL